MSRSSKLPLAGLVSGLGIFAAACAIGPGRDNGMRPPADEIMLVNGLPITQAELDREIEEVIAEAPPNLPEETLREKAPLIRREAVDRLVFDRIIDAAVTEHGITVTDEEVDAEVRTVSEYLSAHGRTLSEVMREVGDTSDSLRLSIRDQLTESKLWDTLLNLQPPTEQELRDYFSKNRDRYIEPEAVHLYQIVKLLPNNENPQKEHELLSEMNLVRNRWQAGEAFPDLARGHSDGPNASKGGEIGWITADVNLPAEVIEAAFTQKVDEVGAIVKSPLGYHLLWVAGRRERRPVPFEEVRPIVEDHFSHERRIDPVIKLYEQMRKEATIVER